MASRFFKSLLSEKKQKTAGNEKRFGSTRLFALKDSRWFTKEESNLFENVLDSGYILELRIASGNNGRNVNKDSAATLEYGIVLWMEKPAREKRRAVVIHLVKRMDKSGRTSSQGVKCSSLESFWGDGTEIRINNMDDCEMRPDTTTKINERVNCASKGSYKWNDSYSFVHWCRYGYPVPPEESTNKKEICNAAIRWGGVSASTGAMYYFSKNQRQRLK